MGKSCVMLGESHTEVYLGIQELLEPIFDTMLMVADEASLIAVVEKSRPDLIVADLSMGGAREADVVRRLKESFPASKFIVLGIHEDCAVVNECLEAGAAGFVLKRSAVDDLVPVVEAVLRGQT